MHKLSFTREEKRKHLNKSRKGKRFEYRVRDALIEAGFKAYLLSNSKPFDIVAWWHYGDIAYIFECKSSKVTKKMCDELWRKCEELTVFPFMVSQKKNKELKYESVAVYTRTECRIEDLIRMTDVG